MAYNIPSRRQFLQGLSCSIAASALSSPSFAASALAASNPATKLYASSRQNKNGSHEAVIFSPRSGDYRVVPLPGRAHDVTAHPFKQQVVAVARRPGRFLVVFSTDKSQVPLELSAKAGRHFQGHGVFSKDGRLFFSAESDYDGERGVIGVRDVSKGYQQIGEYDAGGIGIHELNLHPDGKTLVVANGGILTHPDTGRAKLNLSTMKPSLAYIDAMTGKIVEQHSLPKEWHQLSVRHFDISAQGITVFGCQFQGIKHHKPPLVGFHKRGEKPVLIKAPKAVHHGMQNYVGSVTIDKSGTIAATSAPRGNMVVFWDIQNRSYLSALPFTDSCGLAPTAQEGQFLMSNGQGTVLTYSPKTAKQQLTSYKKSALRWDNHMLAL